MNTYSSTTSGRSRRRDFEPTLGDYDVLVDIHAAGVNLLDAKIRNGEFKLILPYKAPFALGHDLAGVVTRVGPAVTRFAVGDEVYARPRYPPACGSTNPPTPREVAHQIRVPSLSPSLRGSDRLRRAVRLATEPKDTR